jgi:hypothetical protein
MYLRKCKSGGIKRKITLTCFMMFKKCAARAMGEEEEDYVLSFTGRVKSAACSG